VNAWQNKCSSIVLSFTKLEMETDADGLQSKFITFYIHLGYVWITVNLILNYTERGIEAI
jgi:hypothetical protein